LFLLFSAFFFIFLNDRLIKNKYKDFIKDIMEYRKIENMKKDYERRRKEQSIKKQAVEVIEK